MIINLLKRIIEMFVMSIVYAVGCLATNRNLLNRRGTPDTTGRNLKLN